MDPDSFNGKLWLLVIDKLIIGALIAFAFVLYDVYRTTETRRHEEKRTQIQFNFERARLLRDFMPAIADRDLPVTSRGYLLRTAMATKSLDSEGGVEIARELIDDGISEFHLQRIIAPAMPHALPAILQVVERLSRYFTLGELHLIDQWDPPLYRYTLDERSRNALRGAGLSIDLLASLGEGSGDTQLFPTEERFLSFLEKTIGEENTANSKALLLRAASEDYRARRQLLLWRAAIERELPSLLQGTLLEELLPESFIGNHLKGLFALLKSEERTRYGALQNSESRGVRLVGYISQTIAPVDETVDETQYIARSVQEVSRELTSDLTQPENVEYAGFVLEFTRSYSEFYGRNSDQAGRFASLYPLFCDIVVNYKTMGSDINGQLRNTNLYILTMFMDSFLEFVEVRCEAM